MKYLLAWLLGLVVLVVLLYVWGDWIVDIAKAALTMAYAVLGIAAVASIRKNPRQYTARRS